MARFGTWIKTVAGECRPVFVGFNATFDWMFVHLDIKAYFMGKHKSFWGGTAKNKIRTFYPSKAAHSHNALDDATEQAEISGRMMRSGFLV